MTVPDNEISIAGSGEREPRTRRRTRGTLARRVRRSRSSPTTCICAAVCLVVDATGTCASPSTAYSKYRQRGDARLAAAIVRALAVVDALPHPHAEHRVARITQHDEGGARMRLAPPVERVERDAVLVQAVQQRPRAREPRQRGEVRAQLCRIRRCPGAGGSNIPCLPARRRAQGSSSPSARPAARSSSPPASSRSRPQTPYPIADRRRIPARQSRVQTAPLRTASRA